MHSGRAHCHIREHICQVVTAQVVYTTSSPSDALKYYSSVNSLAQREEFITVP